MRKWAAGRYISAEIEELDFKPAQEVFQDDRLHIEENNSRLHQ